MRFPRGSDGKESPCNIRDPGSIAGSGGSLEKGKATHSRIFEWRIPWIQELGSIILVAGTLIETFVLKSYISYSLLPPPLVSSGTIVAVKQCQSQSYPTLYNPKHKRNMSYFKVQLFFHLGMFITLIRKIIIQLLVT